MCVFTLFFKTAYTYAFVYWDLVFDFRLLWHNVLYMRSLKENLFLSSNIIKHNAILVHSFQPFVFLFFTDSANDLFYEVSNVFDMIFLRVFRFRFDFISQSVSFILFCLFCALLWISLNNCHAYIVFIIALNRTF